MSMLDNPVVVAIVVVVAAGYVILRRAIGEPLNLRDLAVPPLVLVLIGGREVLLGDVLTPAQVLALVATGVTALALGAWRGATVRLYLRGSELWYRYRRVTYVVWVATALIGLGIRLSLYAGAAMPPSARSLALTVGLTLAGESLVLAGRGALSGARFSAERRDSEAARALIHQEMRDLARGRSDRGAIRPPRRARDANRWS